MVVPQHGKFSRLPANRAVAHWFATFSCYDFRSMVRNRWLVLSFSLMVLGAACGAQKNGELCQATSDCESGLVCNESTGTCQPSGSAAALTKPDEEKSDDDSASAR